ncbi:MAG: amino acid adenylation domain-containing protein [Paracoccaceae bacterium]|nr:amino acid adenylation domain-containing protein [Paracoccaceae bacterium]
MDEILGGPGTKPLRHVVGAQLDAESAQQEASSTSPSDRLAELWCLVLGRSKVDEDASFSMMGGDSLRSMRLLMLIENEFDRRLQMDTLFGPGATLAGLRRSLNDATSVSKPNKTIPKRTDLCAPIVLNSAQEHIWTKCSTNPTSAMYNSAFSLRLSKDVDLQVVQRSIDYLITRHEALRARFLLQDGLPLQSFDTDPRVSLQIVDLQDEPLETREVTYRKRAQQAAAARYELEVGPPARASAFLLGEMGVGLVFQTHHIIGDVISTAILAEELAAAVAANGTPNLAPIEVSFGDALVWNSDQMVNERQEDLLAEWRKDLGDRVTALRLPLDHDRPIVRSLKGARISIEYDTKIVIGLRRLADLSGASVFTVALAAFELLMHHLSGQREFVLGTGIDTRPDELRDALVGSFTGPVPIPVRIDPSLTFLEHAKATNQRVSRARALRDVPFELLATEFATNTRSGEPPLVQVLCAMMPKDARKQVQHGFQVEYFNFDHDFARFDLTLMMEETDDRLGGFFEYSTDILGAETVHLMSARFEALLSNVIADPVAAISSYTSLPADEAAESLKMSVGPAQDYPRQSSIAEVFAGVAKKYFNKICVQQGDAALTYAELDAWSDGIAAELRQSGVGPEVIVATLMERTPKLIAALLGILKAGGAYLALDPTQPPARLEVLLNDSRAKVILPDRDIARLQSTAKIIDVDGLRGNGEAFERPAIASQSMAYVGYTSGSTGNPKGVCVTQRNVLRLVNGLTDLEIGPDDRMLNFSPTSFDASTFEIWGALLSGATLIQPPSGMPSLNSLADLIVVEDINTIWLTAGLFQQMVDLRPDCFIGHRRVLAGGDVLSTDHVKKALETAPNLVLFNGYGPTENTTFSALHRVTPGQAHGAIPIGRPLANSSTYVLDGDMRPVPIGVEGDLWVGGDGVARGYLNRPEDTAAVFLKDPFQRDEDARLYRTGDRAMWDNDGVLHFHGRQDWQVKMRGFRIEPQEIESALRAFDEVRDAVIIPRQSGAKVTALAAFVVLMDEATLTIDMMRTRLRDHLPTWMIPGEWRIVDLLPLNSNGKIDRNALLALDAPAAIQRIVAPRTPVEELLMEVWEDLLQRNGFGIDESFFDLGGHSLLAMQMSFRLEEDMDLPPSNSYVFQNPTLRSLGEAVLEALIAEDQQGSDPCKSESTNSLAERQALETKLLARRRKKSRIREIPALPRGAPLPLSDAQKSILFAHLVSPNPESYNLVQADLLEGPLNVKALRHAIDEIVVRHEALRVKFDHTRATPVCLASKTTPALEVQWAEDVNAAMKEVNAAATHPFDLLSEPPFRARLLRYTENISLLILNVHHIVSDEWSMRILRSEVAKAYRATCRGVAHDLAELPLQYADFAAWQGQKADTSEQLAVLDRWAGALDGADLDNALPRTSTAPMTPGSSQIVKRPLPDHLTDRLDTFGRASETTPFMTTLAAVICTLHKWTGKTDVTISTQIAGRSCPEVANLIGMFTNTVVVRSQIDRNSSYASILQRVRGTVLDALAQQDIRAEALFQHMKLAHRMEAAPFGRIVFTHRKSFDPLELSEDLLSTEIAPDKEAAWIDLWITIIDHPEGRELRVIYNPARQDKQNMELFAEQIQSAMAAVSRSPEMNLSDLSIQSATKVVESFKTNEFAPFIRNPVQPEIQKIVSDLWKEMLKTQTVEPGVSFFDEGGDSMSMLRLTHLLEERLKVVLPPSGMFADPTPEGIAQFVEDSLQCLDKNEDWDRLIERFPTKLNANSNGTKFFLVAGGGGHVAPFAPVIERLTDRWQGFGVLDPALFDDEKPLWNIEDLATRMATAIRSVDPNGPWILAGYSAGGRAVYEISRKLIQDGGEASCVILDAGLGDQSAFGTLLRLAGKTKRFCRITLRKISDAYANMRIGDRDPVEMDRRRFRRVSDHQHGRLLRGYSPRSNVRVVLVRASETSVGVRRGDYGLSKIADLISIIDAPGDHYNCFKGENAPAFATALEQALKAISAKPSSSENLNEK